MKSSTSVSSLASALAKAQAKFPAIPRSRTVKVQGQRGSYEFSYAPFEDILKATRPVLAEFGLAFTQGADGPNLVTTILHESGEWLSHETAINIGQPGPQAYGSALTYAKRYGYCGAFGIQADDDDDGNAAEGNTVETTKDKSAPQSYNSKKDAFERMNKDEKEFLRKIAADVIALLDEERADDAYGFLRNQNLDTEEQVAIQHLFDSKQRSALAKAGEHYKAVQNASAREQHRNNRPEGQKAAA